MPIFLYSSLLALGLAVSFPWWVWRMMTSGHYRAGLAGRMGRLPASLDGVRQGRAAAEGLIWLHAVSVGEVLAVERLVADLRMSLPQHCIVVSTTTATGQQVARERLTRLRVAVFYYPLDFAFAVRRYLRALRPSLLVTVESEFWPRMLVECERAGIPVAVVNARISDRSFPRYLRLRKLWKPLLSKVTLFLAQGDETADRLKVLGVKPERVLVHGNLKYDAPGASENRVTDQIALLLGQSRLLIAGSTAEGEEQILLSLWPDLLQAVPDMILMLAPRHPQRFDAVVELARKSGYPFFCCSQLIEAAEPIVPGTILILDSIGDLATMYADAAAAFIGGSLVPNGGQNPFEAARFRVPVVMGPHFENFREMVRQMLDQGAIEIAGQPELGGALIRAMSKPPRLREVFTGGTSATQKTLAALIALLEHR